jgi:hypothetical protein
MSKKECKQSGIYTDAKGFLNPRTHIEAGKNAIGSQTITKELLSPFQGQAWKNSDLNSWNLSLVYLHWTLWYVWCMSMIGFCTDRT